MPSKSCRPGLFAVPYFARIFYSFDVCTHTDVHGSLQLLQLLGLLAFRDRIFGLSGEVLPVNPQSSSS